MKERPIDLIIYMFYRAFPVVFIGAMVTGFLGTMEMIYHIKGVIQDTSLVPAVAGEFILKEIAPVIPTLLFIAQIGASFTAELASMKTSEQLDALKVIGISPIRSYLFPRIIAVCITNMLLCLVAIAVIITCAALYSIVVEHYVFANYMSMLKQNIRIDVAITTFIKAFVFGIVCPIICALHGLKAFPTSRGVGIATTQSVVSCTIAIIFLDLIINLF